MKYSGVEWIGKIPDRWEVKKVKQCFYISKEQANQKDPVILSLARSGVKVRDISNNEGQLAASYDNYNVVQPGDLLLNPMDLYSGANCNMSEISGVISPAYTNLRKKVELNPKYFDLYFKTQYWAMAMFAHGKGVSFDNRWTINAESVLNYYLPYPSFDEQNKIVEFIKNKTAEIDSLIEIENKQIEKLKEYKQAVITETVTKGLDKNVPLKDSGVEWIGKMPANWKRIKLVNLFEDIGSGTTPKGDDYYTDGTINWIQSGDINGGFLTSCSSAVNNYAIKEFSALKVYQAPFLIMAMYGGSVGHLSVSKIDGCCNQACCVMRNPKCNFDFAFYSLQAVKNYLLKNAIGGGQPNISQTIIKSIWFCNPSLNEQEEITSFLNEQCFRIDALTSVKQRKIEYLIEYKKSLIYEYVTGKKEVTI